MASIDHALWRRMHQHPSWIYKSLRELPPEVARDLLDEADRQSWNDEQWVRALNSASRSHSENVDDAPSASQAVQGKAGDIVESNEQRRENTMIAPNTTKSTSQGQTGRPRTRGPQESRAECNGWSAPAIDVVALDANAAAVMFSMSVRTWRRHDLSGRIPQGFHVGGRKLWRKSDLERWAELGFPDRATFTTIQRERAGSKGRRN